jgi:TolB-like protein/Flp pilus assembly protein TadD
METPAVRRPRNRTPFSFAEFVLDPFAYELRREGRTVKVERRPMELLILLLERRGELVTREEIADRLWGSGVFIDIDTSINTLVRKVRRALRDSAMRSRFVQTVQGKGYRFVADTQPVGHRAVVVVLPFENLQQDPAQEYVADGITEETIVGLGRMGPDRLSVIGRTTSMAYRRTKRTIGDIGNDLGADYVVEGSVRAAAGRVRVSATLSRVRDQVQIWTESYERDAGDLLGLQSALGQDIAEQIHLRLSSPQRADSAPHRQTRHQRAYDLYLRGRYYYNQMTPATAERALHCFREATDHDPTYSLAWAGIADTYSSRLFNSDTKPSDVIGEARVAAAAAMAAGASVAEAQTAVAVIQFLFDWNWRTAETHLRRAVALNPSSAQSYWMLGHALTQQGRHEEALAAAARALELDPLDALTHGMAAQIAYSAGRTDLAATHAKDALLVEPDFWVGQWQLGQTYEQMGRTNEALEVLAHASRLSNGNSKPVSLTAYLLARSGRANEAREILETLECRAREAFVPPVAVALGHLGLGDTEKVFERLEQALAVRDVHLIYVPWDVKWQALRGEKRFRDLLRRAGLGAEPAH